MDISDQDKVQVLLTLLRERYNAAHKMRRRSERFAVWVLGLAFSVIWFLLLKNSTFSLHQRIVLAAIVFAIAILTFFYQKGIQEGFNRNRETMIRLEEALKAYEDGVYTNEKMFPTDYKQIHKFPSSKSLSYHFCLIHLLTWSITIMLIILIFVGPVL